jgi:hypothetical protein
MERRSQQPLFDRLRASGTGLEIVGDSPFMLSLSNHERRLHGTSHLGKLYYVSVAAIQGMV